MGTKNIHYNNTNTNFKIWIDDGVIKINTGKEKWRIETMVSCMEEFDGLI